MNLVHLTNIIHRLEKFAVFSKDFLTGDDLIYSFLLHGADRNLCRQVSWQMTMGPMSSKCRE